MPRDTILALRDGETLVDAFERVTRERDAMTHAAMLLERTCSELQAERDEAQAQVERLTVDRDKQFDARMVANRDYVAIRELLREVANSQRLSSLLNEYLDVQMPTRVWKAIQAAREGSR